MEDLLATKGKFDRGATEHCSSKAQDLGPIHGCFQPVRACLKIGGS